VRRNIAVEGHSLIAGGYSQKNIGKRMLELLEKWK
jgi:hypothetical protein